MMDEGFRGWRRAIVFEVRGDPVPQGSMRAFTVTRKGGKVGVGMTPSNEHTLNDWRHLIRDVAQRSAPPAPWEGPVALSVVFHLRQPVTRPTAAGRGKDRHTIRIWPDRRPDLDKLARGIMDALTGVFYFDDAQVVVLDAIKDYGVPGVTVRAWRVGQVPP